MDGSTTGVYNNLWFRTALRTTQVEPNVERITSPNPVCRRVEVEDVKSDDKDNDEENESSHAPQVEVRNDHEEEEEETKSPQQGRGHRMQTPTNFYQADFSNKRYNYPYEADVIHSCHHGTAYGAKRELKEDFINAAAQLDRLIDENPFSVGLTDEQLDDHMIGVIMASHYFLKRELRYLGIEPKRLLLNNYRLFTTCVCMSL